jgi:hypothetical protein
MNLQKDQRGRIPGEMKDGIIELMLRSVIGINLGSIFHSPNY